MLALIAALMLTADDAADAGTEPPPVPPPPGWLAWKPALSAGDLARKKEGWYVTGLPLLNYDTNTGFGFGARGYLYDDSNRKSDLFAYEPYRNRLFVQAFFSTAGLQYHVLDYDAPYFLGSPFRVRLELGYIRAQSTPYFGRGEVTMQPLTFQGQPYSSYAAYSAALNSVQPNGTTYALYDTVDAERPYFDARLERQFLEGRLRVLGQLNFAHASMKYFQAGTMVNAIDAKGNTVQAPLAGSRMADDCARGAVIGCAGGWDNLVSLGASYDTRDYEPDPNSGMFAEAVLQWATRALGSDYDYVRFLGALRGYYSPFPEWADLVLAGRFTMELQSAGVPVFSEQIIPYLETFTLGLGGNRTLRGYRAMRFVGPQMAFANLEVRWTFVRWTMFNQQVGLILAPFFDTGRVWDRVSEISLNGWKYSGGSGLRISWNQATILMCDVGFSPEDWGIYFNFGHIF
jgi:outer membrane protein assembly factor BamA